MPVLHKRPHQGGLASRRLAEGVDRGDLGSSRNARRRCLCSFGAGDRGNGKPLEGQGAVTADFSCTPAANPINGDQRQRSASAMQSIAALGQRTGGLVHDYRINLAIVGSRMRLAERQWEDLETARVCLQAAGGGGGG